MSIDQSPTSADALSYAPLEERMNAFIQAAKACDLIAVMDEIYIRNRILALLDEDRYDEAACQVEGDKTSPQKQLLIAMDSLVAYAREKGLIDDTQAQKEQLEAALMDLFLPLPSEMNRRFQADLAQDPKIATDRFYCYSQLSDYIKTRQIEKNIAFTYPSIYGEIELTINLSKPEKTTAEIAAAQNREASSYPKCPLCLSNEGYRGRLDAPARQNHRLIHLDLADGPYAFQYSPYVYYPEHCIVIASKHEPMRIDRLTFYNLLSFIDILPHYFIGSNADLPGVGGSILSHDHFQGGRHVFPMDRASRLMTVVFPAYPAVKAEILNWPMSVIRLTCDDREQLCQLAEHIRLNWANYSDPALEILSHTANTPHNTITPIARRDGKWDVMNIVLRNNRQTDQYPQGIFHPHPSRQHIKQENIGLIEVMGLAILPPRLEGELAQVEAYLADQCPLSEVATIHQAWAEALKANRPASREELAAYLKKAVGQIFTEILEDAGVFKNNPAGHQGFSRFIQACGGVLH